MPIKGRSEIVRIPRVGKIHLGIKVSNGDSQYPKAVDYFVVKEDESTSATAAEAFHTVYGDAPKEIRIAFPSNNPENFFPQFLSSYRKAGGRSELYCKGDGEMARRVDGQGGYAEIPCAYRDCPIYQEKKCKELGLLQFFLPDVPGIGVWQIDTTSFFSTVNLNSSIEMLLQLTGGKIAMLPLTLRLKPQTVSPDGRSKTVYVLELATDTIKMADILNQLPQLPNANPALEEISLDEAPGDLYVERDFVTEGLGAPNSAEPTIPPRNTNGRNTGQTLNRRPPSQPEETSVTDSQNYYRGGFTKSFFTQQGRTEVAKVVFVTEDNQQLEVLTADPKLVEAVKNLEGGEVVKFNFQPSTRWKDRLELTNLVVA
ncbi:hypothetical protein [Alicyclobacillus fodiniaquatilis]|uniref:Uncharacterized protein n=1 Tax=Alicyclobacillus fodiniaquatilis TaxID=1661150 RepID=A0ABW4JLS5_9BACL